MQPRRCELDLIHSTYVEIAKAGNSSEEQRDAPRNLAQKLIRRERLDAIVLAGTELALAFDDSSAGFPIIDCASIHIAAIVRSILG